MSDSIQKPGKKRLARKVDYDDIEPSVKQEPIGELQIIDYTEKSFVVVGDTLTHSNALGTLGGKYNMNLRIGKGWIFSKMRKESVEKYIATGVIEPYVYDKSAYGKKQAVDKDTVKKIFREFREAFDPDAEYEGEVVLDVISQLEKKWLATV